MKLNLPRRTKRRLPARVQRPMVVDARPNAEWSMDFMSDTLYHGRRFRTLNVLDEGVREAWLSWWIHRSQAVASFALSISWLSGGESRKPYASTTVRNTCRRSSPTGAKATASNSTTYSRENRPLPITFPEEPNVIQKYFPKFFINHEITTYQIANRGANICHGQ